MRIFIRGNDDGNAVLAVLVFILILSTLFISFASRISAASAFSREYKARVLNAIEQENRELRERYDLY